MCEPTTPPMRPSEARARQRVAELLEWAGKELGLDPTAARACTPELVDSACRAQAVASLPPAHQELLLRAGGGGPGSVLVAIFDTDSVGVDAMIGGLGLAPMRRTALERAERSGYGLDEFDVVIRVRQGREFEYVVTGSPDPPVWAFLEGQVDPVLRHPLFTQWLQYRILRAVKRRHPLRTVTFPGSATVR